MNIIPDEDSFGESKESNSTTSFSLQDFKILICNIRSIAGKVAELMQIVNDESIQCIFLQETWLDASIQSFQLPNFVCLARKDRADGPNRGGVAIFVRSDIANMTFLQHGSAGETSWLLLHRDAGTIALCNCYFPPTYRPEDFHLFSNDIDKMHDKADYFFISGDFNVHSKAWLHFPQTTLRKETP